MESLCPTLRTAALRPRLGDSESDGAAHVLAREPFGSRLPWRTALLPSCEVRGFSQDEGESVDEARRGASIVRRVPGSGPGAHSSSLCIQWRIRSVGERFPRYRSRHAGRRRWRIVVVGCASFLFSSANFLIEEHIDSERAAVPRRLYEYKPDRKVHGSIFKRLFGRRSVRIGDLQRLYLLRASAPLRVGRTYSFKYIGTLHSQSRTPPLAERTVRIVSSGPWEKAALDIATKPTRIGHLYYDA